MPRPVRPHRVLVAAASATALVLALPSAAYASHHPKPTHKSFAAHGLVLRHTSSSLTVLASSARTGKHSRHNAAVTVALPSRRTAAGRSLAKRLARTHAGDGISIVGTATHGKVVARNFAVKPAPFHVYLGRITAIHDALVTVAKGAQSSDDSREGHRGHFTVDTSEANVSLDGDAVDSALDLAAGDAVAVLGSSVADVVVATSVFGFTDAQDVITGRVTAVNDPLITVDSHDRRGPGSHAREDGDGGDGGDGTDDGSDDGDSTGTTVSLDSAAVIVDGTSNAPVSAITAGSRVLALGVDNEDGTFDAGLAFAFTQHCNSRHHGDGGQDEDGDS